MNWEDIDRHPTDRKVRQFAGLCFLALSVLATLALLSGHQARAIGFAVFAVTIGVGGAFVPGAVRPFFVATSILTFPIGWMVSLIVLAIIFYCVLTPLALILRLSGRDPLNLHDQSSEPSLWRDRHESDDQNRYFRQF